MKAKPAKFSGDNSNNQFSLTNIPSGIDPTNLSGWVAKTWLEEHDAYDHGALTAYLLRRFGLPNLLAYEVYKHGARWGVAVGDAGIILEIEPRPCAPINDWSKMNKIEKMHAHRSLSYSDIFSLGCIVAQPIVIDFNLFEPMLKKTIRDFQRPTYWRDTYADANRVLTNDDIQKRPEAEISEAANIAIHPNLESKNGTYKVIDEKGRTLFLDDSFKTLQSKRTKLALSK